MFEISRKPIKKKNQNQECTEVLVEENGIKMYKEI